MSMSELFIFTCWPPMLRSDWKWRANGLYYVSFLFAPLRRSRFTSTAALGPICSCLCTTTSKEDDEMDSHTSSTSMVAIRLGACSTTLFIAVRWSSFWTLGPWPDQQWERPTWLGSGQVHHWCHVSFVISMTSFFRYLTPRLRRLATQSSTAVFS